MKVTINSLLTAMIFAVVFSFFNINSFAQNIGINSTGADPDPSALLDVDSDGSNPKKGLLVPRMTSAERDAIVSPAYSLLIFNTTSTCFEAYDTQSSSWVAFGCIGCPLPINVNASVASSSVCEGGTINLIGEGTFATSWSWTGPNGFSSTSQSPTLTNVTASNEGVYTLTATNDCGSADPVSTASVTVNVSPSGVSASANPSSICEGSTLSLSGSATDATSWSWTGPNSFTSSTQNPTVSNITTSEAGIYKLTAINDCGSATPVSTASVTVNSAPPMANAGSDQELMCGETTATLSGNSAGTGTGNWSVVSGTASITNSSSPTSGITGLASSGSVTLRWTISGTSPCPSSYDDVTITSCEPYSCGRDNTTSVVQVTGANGKKWMDRNLGASKKASYSSDSDAYGGLYQWGRCHDGHEKRTSGTTATKSTTDTPGNSKFITGGFSDKDWRSSGNNNLWQGESSTNNPCPSGYRVPTKAEFQAELDSWGSYNDDANGAINSALKLPTGGVRYNNGSIGATGQDSNPYGHYWTSTLSGGSSTSSPWRFYFYSSAADFSNYDTRLYGRSVRCIKD